MAYKIDKEKCIGCGACASNCPMECIFQDSDGKYFIDQDRCISCGTCAGVCPVSAPDAE